MNELSALAAKLGELLKERKETVAVAESSAGGLISAALLAVPGASAYFMGGAVVYTQAARRALLRVPDEAVAGIRSSTEAYALLKARTIRTQCSAPPGAWPRRGPAAPPAIAMAMRPDTPAWPWPAPSSVS